MLVLVLVSLFAGCAGLVRDANEQMATGITAAILNQNDVETARDGIPAYLVMLDGMLERDPDNVSLLLAAARLYGAYASAFVEEGDRAALLATRGKGYAERALCLGMTEICQARSGSLEEFRVSLAGVARSEIPLLYGFAVAWAGWVQADTSNWHGIADIPYIAAAMQRVVDVDEAFDGGGAHLYLGVLDTRLPPHLGGKPEEGRKHFERAIALAGGKNLMAKVLFARHYARLVFDRDLHDALINEVIQADPEAPGYTLINMLAKREARKLREDADRYF